MHRLSVLALLAPALAAQTPAPDRGVNFYSIEKEQALGAQLAAEYQRSEKPSHTVKREELKLKMDRISKGRCRNRYAPMA